MIEKRKNARYKTFVTVMYKRSNDESGDWRDTAQIKNISLGGMLFSAYEKMPVSTQLILELRVPTADSKAKMVILYGKVVMVEDGVLTYDTRVKLGDLDMVNKAALKEFIEHIS